MTIKEPLNLDTVERIIKFIDKSPAVTWTGKGGVRERILELVESERSD